MSLKRLRALLVQSTAAQLSTTSRRAVIPPRCPPTKNSPPPRREYQVPPSQQEYIQAPKAASVTKAAKQSVSLENSDASGLATAAADTTTVRGAERDPVALGMGPAKTTANKNLKRRADEETGAIENEARVKLEAQREYNRNPMEPKNRTLAQHPVHGCWRIILQ